MTLLQFAHLPGNKSRHNSAHLERSTTYFIISKEPESRRLVVFVVGDVEVVGSGLEDGILTAGFYFGFGFHHLAGVQRGLEAGDRWPLARWIPLRQHQETL